MGSWIAENTAVALVLAAIAFVASRTVARRRPAVAHALWVLVLLKLVLPPIGFAGFPPRVAREWVESAGERARESMAAAIEPVRQAIERIPAPERPRPASPARETRRVARSGGSAVLPVTGFAGDVADATPFVPLAVPARRSTSFAFAESALAKLPIESILLALWAVGSAFVLGRYLARAARLRGLAARATPAPPELAFAIADVAARLGLAPIAARVSPLVASPFVFALGRPVLVWPASDSDFDRGVIAHELAHLRRADHIVAWLELAAASLLFWHPLVHVARREARRHAELACDAWAVAVAPDGRGAYARALLRAAETLSGPAAASVDSAATIALPALGAFDARYRDLERRLDMILRRSVSCRVTPLLGAAVVIAAIVSLPSWISGAPGDGDSSPRVRTAEYRPEFDRPVRQLLLEEPGGGRVVTGAVDERIGSIPGYRASATHVGIATLEGDDWDGGAIELDEDADVGGESCCETEANECEPCEPCEPCCEDGEEEDEEDAGGLVVEEDQEEEESTEAGITLLRRGEYEKAIRAFTREVEEGNEQTGLYNIACCYSLAGDQDTAIEYLRRCVDAGYSNIDWMLRDDDLAALRDDDRLCEIGRVARDREVLAQFGAASWEELGEREERAVEKGSRSGDAWLRLGWARLRTGDLAGARGAFEQQVACGYSTAIGHYNLACADAMRGEADSAFEELESAFAGGFSQLHHLRNDADLVALHADPRWTAFVAKMRQRYGDCECDRPATPTPPRREVI